MWVTIHKCTEAMLGISLYNYLYTKQTKMICLSYYLLCFLFNKFGKEGGIGSAWKWGFEEGGEEEAQTMYTQVSKCKNDKIKGEKKE
jgi:hypothetical protein